MDLVGVRYDVVLLIMSLLSIGGSLLFPNAKVADIFNERFLVPFGLGYLTVIPASVLIAAKLRPRRVLNLKTLSEKGPEL